MEKKIDNKIDNKITKSITRKSNPPKIKKQRYIVDSKIDNIVNVLTEDYRRMHTQINDHLKLEYQLIGLVYAISGAALSFWLGAKSQPKQIIILFFPPIFCAVDLFQLYLHSHIKSSARYINFVLRPKIESILNPNMITNSNKYNFWEWEEFYVKSHGIPRYFIRLLSSIVIFFPLLPAGAALMIFYYISSTPWSKAEGILFNIDLIVVFLNFIFIILVMFINDLWWKLEQKKLQT